MKPILEVQNLSKEFKIGLKQEPYLSLRDVLAKPFAAKAKRTETFMALDDVSFNVSAGESIGIIGRNGAGKSTLLKILSKIIPPSKGKIICRGRIASLLEVGTGFHPELTGRENIFMNGSILGMRKAEIDKHFDAIVDFSGVEKFIDTPLKRYSSGMQLRLAFAVAAHLEPEILIIDEVLAVGDAAFQKKCLGKMDEVSKSGRTVLFVSHDMNAVEHLCSKSIILQNGVLIDSGPSYQLIAKYLNTNKEVHHNQITLTDEVTLQQLRFTNNEIFSGNELEFNINMNCTSSTMPVLTDFCLLFYTLKGVRAAIIDLRPWLDQVKKIDSTINITGTINPVDLIEGEYLVGIYYGINAVRKEKLDITHLHIKQNLSNNTTVQPYLPQHRGFVELSRNIKIKQ
jgi:lipopolysaccharide transport system ATP-binding protein